MVVSGSNVSDLQKMGMLSTMGETFSICGTLIVMLMVFGIPLYCVDGKVDVKDDVFVDPGIYKEDRRILHFGFCARNGLISALSSLGVSLLSSFMGQ